MTGLDLITRAEAGRILGVGVDRVRKLEVLVGLRRHRTVYRTLLEREQVEALRTVREEMQR